MPPASWELLLCYEHEVRNEMSMLLLKGLALDAALRAAWSDAVVKERFFTTPLALAHLKRAAPEGPPSYPPGGLSKKARAAVNKSAGKMDSKGKGAGKGAGKNAKKCKFKTADGEDICFAFNDAKKGCNKGKECRFSHVCGMCFKAIVPMGQCGH